MISLNKGKQHTQNIHVYFFTQNCAELELSTLYFVTVNLWNLATLHNHLQRISRELEMEG
jgi:hypothetical protein